MDGVSWWDIGLWLGFAYLAVSALVRLMRARRDQLLREFRGHLEAQRQRERGARQATLP